jgi:hypothetical protein
MNRASKMALIPSKYDGKACHYDFVDFYWMAGIK